MNLQNIISELEKADPEIYDRLDTRRNAMKGFASFSGKVAMASVPVALGSMLKKAYGKNTDAIGDVLNFALTLEYLESSFYNTGTAAVGLIPSDDLGSAGAFAEITKDENEHVTFLQSAITSLGQTPVSKPLFDFTAKGTFPTVFTDYDVFLAVSQTFEDTGVRAYKGQAPNLMTAPPILTAALQIHSVEARHASRVRKLRHDRNGKLVAGAVKPWITGKQSGIEAGSADAAIQKSYDGEENTTQATVNIVSIGGNAFIDANAASEAFDEPLTKEQILAIVTPFFA